MKPYELTCPECGEKESIHMMAHDPGQLHCESCDTDIDLDRIRAILIGWKPFIDDYDEMMKGKHSGRNNDKI